MTELRLRDNTLAFEPLPEFCNSLVGKSLGELQEAGFFIYPSQLAVSTDLDVDQVLFTPYQSGYLTGNVAGFLGQGESLVTITSRFAKDGTDHLLRYLLTETLGAPNVVDSTADLNREDQSLVLMSFLFAYLLRRAMRKGLYKTYRRRRANDAHVRGTIDVARHIKLNTPFVGKVAYDYRELTADNAVLALVRQAEVVLAHQPGLTMVKAELDQLNAAVVFRPNDLAKTLAWNTNHPVGHAYYHEYRDLQRFCVWLLRFRRLGVGDGSFAGQGLLFDIADLWEEYLNVVLGDWFIHPNNRERLHAHHLLRDDASGRRQATIYPDFISRQLHPRVILDAKYKPAENIGKDDLYRMLVYLLRFNSKLGIFVHPVTDTALAYQAQHLFTNDEENAVGDTRLLRLGIPIPQGCRGYAEFVAGMRESEQALRDVVDKELSRA